MNRYVTYGRMHATRSSSPLPGLIVAGMVSHLVWPCPIRDDAARLWIVGLKKSNIETEKNRVAVGYNALYVAVGFLSGGIARCLFLLNCNNRIIQGNEELLG